MIGDSPFNSEYKFEDADMDRLSRPLVSPVTGREYHDASIESVHYAGDAYWLSVRDHGALLVPIDAFENLLPEHKTVSLVVDSIPTQSRRSNGQFGSRKTDEQIGADTAVVLTEHLVNRRVLAVTADGGLEDIAKKVEPKIIGGGSIGGCGGMKKFLF